MENKEEKRSIIQEFKDFAFRGNVLDLAVAVVLGAAFNDIVKSFVGDIMMPLIGSLADTDSISKLTVQIGSATLEYGAFIAAIIHFFLIALGIFIIVKVINRFYKKEEEETGPTQEELLTEIRDILKKSEER
jgi:large conductance mechanosensitive channel